MDDSGIVKRCFAHEFGQKLYPLPRGVTPPSGYKSLRLRTFSATGASPPVNLPSIKGAGPTTPRRDRAKTSFFQLLTDPDGIGQFTAISALLSTTEFVWVLSDIPVL